MVPKNAPTSLVTRVVARDPVWENATRAPPRPLCPNESTYQRRSPREHHPHSWQRRREVSIVAKRKVPLPPQLKRINLNAAGIDIGSEEHWAAVPPGRDSEGRDVRSFGDLHRRFVRSSRLAEAMRD